MVVVRRAERADAQALLDLIQALADYERLPGPDAGARERLIRDGWPENGAPPRFTAWLAELEEGANSIHTVGYAITMDTYSTFLARTTFYIEDLFVLPAYRRQAVGSALMNHLIAEAQDRSCGRIEWVVLDWNTSAQQFYQRFGAEHLADWQYYRLSLHLSGQ